MKEFHYRLSESLRKYVEHQFHFATLDRTIEEIRGSIGDVKDLSEEAREAFLAILRRSDQAKFSDVEFAVEESSDMLGQSRAFVLETKPPEDLQEDRVI